MKIQMVVIAIILLIYGCTQSRCNTNQDCLGSEECLQGKCVVKTEIPTNVYSASNYTACRVDNCLTFLCADSVSTGKILQCKVIDQKSAFAMQAQNWAQQNFMLGAGPTFLDFGEFGDISGYNNIMPARGSISAQCTVQSIASYLTPGIYNNSPENMCNSQIQCYSRGSLALCRNDVSSTYGCVNQSGSVVRCDCTQNGFGSTCGNTFIGSCNGSLGASDGHNNIVTNPGSCQFTNVSGHISMTLVPLGFCEPSTGLTLAAQIITDNPTSQDTGANYMGVKEFARQGSSPPTLNGQSQYVNRQYQWFSYQAEEFIKRHIIPVFVTESAFNTPNENNKRISDSALESLASDMNNVANYAAIPSQELKVGAFDASNPGQMAQLLNGSSEPEGAVIITVDDGNQASIVKKTCKNCLTALMVPNYDDTIKCTNYNLGQTGNRWGSNWNTCAVDYVASQVVQHGSDIDIIGQRLLFDREAWSIYKSAADCRNDNSIFETVFNNKLAQSQAILEKTNKASILIYFGARRTDYPGGDNCWSETSVDNAFNYAFGHIKNLTDLGYIGLINMYYDDEILGTNLPNADNISKLSYWDQGSSGHGPTGLCASQLTDASGSRMTVQCPISMSVDGWIKDDPSGSDTPVHVENGITRVKDGYGINGYWAFVNNHWEYESKQRKDTWFNGCRAYANSGQTYLSAQEVSNDTAMPECGPSSNSTPTDCWFEVNGQRMTYVNVQAGSTPGQNLAFPQYGQQTYGCAANLEEAACLTQ